MTRTDTSHERVTRFFGLSTDTKPTNAMIGATFTETDTQKEFLYDGVNWTRDKMVVVEQVGPVIVEEVRDTNALLEHILQQLKIQNTHLAMVTDEMLGEMDIEEGT